MQGKEFCFLLIVLVYTLTAAMLLINSTFVGCCHTLLTLKLALRFFTFSRLKFFKFKSFFHGHFLLQFPLLWAVAGEDHTSHREELETVFDRLLAFAPPITTSRMANLCSRYCILTAHTASCSFAFCGNQASVKLIRFRKSFLAKQTRRLQIAQIFITVW